MCRFCESNNEQFIAALYELTRCLNRLTQQGASQSYKTISMAINTLSKLRTDHVNQLAVNWKDFYLRFRQASNDVFLTDQYFTGLEYEGLTEIRDMSEVEAVLEATTADETATLALIRQGLLSANRRDLMRSFPAILVETLNFDLTYTSDELPSGEYLNARATLLFNKIIELICYLIEHDIAPQHIFQSLHHFLHI